MARCANHRRARILCGWWGTSRIDERCEFLITSIKNAKVNAGMFANEFSARFRYLRRAVGDGETRESIVTTTTTASLDNGGIQRSRRDI